MKYRVSFDLGFRKHKYKGKFIAIEGIDGSGKTLQTQMVVKALKKRGLKVISTKEPTDRVIGKFIKTQILTGKIKLPPVAIQYIFSADRSDHQVEIEKYLEKGYVVIMDRYFWSAVAYGIADLKQVAGYYLTVLSVLSPYNRFLAPDITFFLNISIKTALKRIGKSEKHNEIYDNEAKLIKIKKAYDFLVKKFTKEFVLIDGNREVEEVTADLVKRIEKK